MKIFLMLFLSLSSVYVQSSCVVLLHGLARTDGSMKKLEKRLSRSGFQVVNLGYPSREYNIEALAKKAISPALKQCNGAEEVNFVTH